MLNLALRLAFTFLTLDYFSLERGKFYVGSRFKDLFLNGRFNTILYLGI